MAVIGDEIKKFRELKKLTQSQLANEVGESQPTVGGWEKGRTKPSVEQIQKIADALKIDVIDLIGSLKKENKGIEFYSDIDVTGGNDNLFDDGRTLPTGYIHIPNFEDCDKAFPLYGDSMYPKYQAGQIILCKEFTEWRDFVPYGEVFLIITDSLRMVKYVKKASTMENYLLVSENEHFEDFEVPKHRIQRMFLVKGAIHRNMI